MNASISGMQKAEFRTIEAMCSTYIIPDDDDLFIATIDKSCCGAEESGADDGKATIIGVLFSIALEIAIFSSYPAPEAHGKH